MGNTIKTLSAGDITRKALQILHNNLVFCKSINKEYDSRFAKSGAKNGGTLLIREPNQFTIRDGAVMNTQDVTERTQTLTVATQKGVDINFSSVELTLSLDDFSKRIIEPAITRLAAEVDKAVISNVYPYVPKLVNTAFGTKPVLTDVLAARAALQQGLAPTSNRILMTDSLAANSIITSGTSLYNPAGEISRQYSTGLLGSLYSFQHYESEMTPVHTNGTRTDATPVVDISTISNGDTTITTTGQTNGQTIKVGDVFTIADVYDVNPETKVSTGSLKQFSIGADLTCDATDVFTLTWPIYKSGPYQNVYAAAWTGSKAIVHVAAGGSGTASAALRHSLAYHRDAFTVVTADLEMPTGVDFAYRAKMDNISMRLVRNFDIVNDKFPCRIDVLFGSKCLRPEWACRVPS
jgi:hypothetical protein